MPEDRAHTGVGAWFKMLRVGDLIELDPLAGDAFDAPSCTSCGTVLRDPDAVLCEGCA